MQVVNTLCLCQMKTSRCVDDQRACTAAVQSTSHQHAALRVSVDACRERHGRLPPSAAELQWTCLVQTMPIPCHRSDLATSCTFVISVLQVLPADKPYCKGCSMARHACSLPASLYIASSTVQLGSYTTRLFLRQLCGVHWQTVILPFSMNEAGVLSCLCSLAPECSTWLQQPPQCCWMLTDANISFPKKLAPSEKLWSWDKHAHWSA